MRRQEIVRGDTLNQPALVFLQTDGAPVDLTGVTARMMIRSRNDTLVYDATSTIIIDLLTGKLTFSVPSTETELWLLGKKYFFDIELTFPANVDNPLPVVVTFLSTELTVVKDYSRS